MPIALQTLFAEGLQSGETPALAAGVSPLVMDVSDIDGVQQIFPQGTAAKVAASTAGALAQSAPFAVFSRRWQVQAAYPKNLMREREGSVLPRVLLLGTGATLLLMGGLIALRRHMAGIARRATIAAEEMRNAANQARSVELAALQQTYEVEGAIRLNKIQSEQVSSVATILGGVADEVNAPLNTVNANVQALLDINEQLASAVEDRTRLMRQLPKWDSLSSAEQKTWFQASIHSSEALDEIKLRDLFDAADNVTVEMLEALQQISDTVRSLKQFSPGGNSASLAIDLNHCLDTALAIAQHHARNAAKIAKRYGAPLFVKGDPSRIRHVMLVLIRNAAQSMQGFGAIDVVTRAEGGYAIIEVTDNGAPIGQADTARIFDPTFAVTHNGGRNTFGLADCEKMIRAQGGRLTARSLGQETLFTISLPLGGA